MGTIERLTVALSIGLFASVIGCDSIAPKAVARPASYHFPSIRSCYNTRIKDVTTRLADGSDNTPVPDSGTAVDYADQHYMVSYDTVPNVERWKKGDSIRLCVAGLPHNCPHGDHRGILYRAYNLSRHNHWTAMDSEHGCGGA